MADEVIVCADGSDLSTRALAAGLAVLGPEVTPIVATVVEPPDPMLVMGTGIAGGTMSGAEYDALARDRVAAAEALARETASALGVPDATVRVEEGDPGAAICDLAAQIGARAIVIGTRGRGGIKRALLGSVSDHVIRNAPCPVVVTGPADSG